MARSYKVDKWTYQKVPDKDTPYKCHCSWCRCIHFHKSLAKIHQLEVTKALNNMSLSPLT